MKKVLVVAPAYTRSGYGEMARFALRALREHEDKFDIYLNPIIWGQTGWLENYSDPEYRWMQSLRIKTENYVKQGGQFDLSIQITIPNEFKKLAPVNIGYTAGIETTHISPAWLEPSNAMDKIIVISEHSKKGFLETVFADQAGNTHKVNTPVEVVHLPYREVQAEPLELNLTTDNNFLCIAQWGPRKNVEQLLETFFQTFKENSDVGLILKTNRAADHHIDREFVKDALSNMREKHKDAKCKLYLLHGTLSEGQLKTLYTHPKVKAFVTATHGEGYGMPLFEAACNDLPVIAPNWSGHLDFLTVDGKEMFSDVKFQLATIPDSAVWQGVMEKGTGWAYPDTLSLKKRMTEITTGEYARIKARAVKHGKWIREKFNINKLNEDFFFSLGVYSRPKKLILEPIDSISFCIPTNGKRPEKTELTIKSIKKQNWDNIPYEIILCGDIDNFKNIDSINLIDQKEAAHTRKVALLRNKAANSSKFKNIVFCDDDVILSHDWLDKTLKFSNEKPWEVLGNKVLSPDGTRYWDRATINPHMLVDYNHPQEDKKLYQSSAFFMVRKSVFKKVKWDETKLVYADREGGIPEDLKFSYDLISNNFLLTFNKEALVWHFDSKYSAIEIDKRLITYNKDLNHIQSTYIIEEHLRFKKVLEWAKK
jgi:glycosyltransferase involved in cell wall biosynthesis